MNQPKSKMAWLWENMKGKRLMFIMGLIGAVVYSSMQLIVPYYSGKIVDTFLSGTTEEAIVKISTQRDLFYTLIALMIGLTIL